LQIADYKLLKAYSLQPNATCHSRKPMAVAFWGLRLIADILSFFKMTKKQTDINFSSKVSSLKSTGLLPVMEHFYTIQGEGFHQGSAAYFIRLGGCDVGCPWCDVKESWAFEGHPMMTVEQIVEEVKKTHTDVAVITGGEPLLHHLQELTTALKNEKIGTHLETSGSSPLSGQWDWICISPKKFKKPLDDLLKAAHELKVVVFNKSDFDWAKKHATLVSQDCKLYLQPEWSKADKMMPMIIEYIKSHPKWKLSLQIHKFINVP
jgi:7-carboxy-7-deazaguanine synthase